MAHALSTKPKLMHQLVRTRLFVSMSAKRRSCFDHRKVRSGRLCEMGLCLKGVPLVVEHMANQSINRTVKKLRFLPAGYFNR